MALGEAQVREILTALDTLSGGSYAGDSRRCARLIARTPLQIVPCTGGKLVAASTVLLLDYSAAGIGFRAYQPMELGQAFFLRLPLRQGAMTYIPCVVANCAHLDDGAFRIGAQFQDVGVDPGQADDAPTYGRLDVEALRQALLS